MAHRSVRDSNGRRWEVWDVHPTAVERRVAMDRRHDARVSPERRQRAHPRLVVPDSLRDGWLAFESAGDRRRVTPIPQNWVALSDPQLLRLAADAEHLNNGTRLSVYR